MAETVAGASEKMPTRSSAVLVFNRLRRRIAHLLRLGITTPEPPSPWPHPHLNFPALTSADLVEAKLFATRHDLIAALSIPRRGIIAEVGVGLGDFSLYLMEALDPAQIYGH